MKQMQPSKSHENAQTADLMEFQYELLTAASVAAADGFEGVAQAFLHLAESGAVGQNSAFEEGAEQRPKAGG
ncbi:hypothetical protein [Celeribacter sp. SCSIO 80788]|uniref:hypothetical protein n=1 Tax=Celeribacter sp. SCSIO 80788 TaxID=3117013 RepID=UPI003DA69C3A